MKLDYAAKSVTKGGVLKIKNNTNTAAPFSVSAIKNGETVATEWYDGHTGTAEIQMKGKLVGADADRYIINNDGTMPELNRDNNEVKTSGMLPTCLPVAPKFLLGLDDPHKAEFYIAPAIAWNNYDKTQLGLLLHSGVLPTATEWAIAPMYAFGSNQITGVAELKHHFYPDNGGSLYRFTLGADAKRFSDFAALNGDYKTQYWRASPFAQVEFAENGNSKLSHIITLRTNFINEESAINDFDPIAFTSTYTGKSNETRIVNDLKYELNNGRKLNPYNIQAQITQSADNGNEAFVRMNVSGEFTATYKKNGDGLTLRGFVGFIPFYPNVNFNTGKYAYSLAQNGSTDIAYDQYYFGRTDNAQNIWSQQVGTGGGGFKYPQGGYYASYGRSDAFVAAINIKAALPFRLPLGIPLKPYFDLGYHQITDPYLLKNGYPVNPDDQILYQGGVMLDFAKGAFNMNFPLFSSENLDFVIKARNGGDYWKSVTFTLDVMKLNPRKIIKGLL